MAMMKLSDKDTKNSSFNYVQVFKGKYVMRKKELPMDE